MTWEIFKEYRQLVRERNYSGSHMDRMLGSIAYLKRRFEFPELCTILVFPDFDEKIYRIYREELSDTGARHFLTGVRKFRAFLVKKHIIDEIKNPKDLEDHPADHFANFLRENEYNKSYSKEMCRHLRQALKVDTFEHLKNVFQDQMIEKAYFQKVRNSFHPTFSTRRIAALRLFKKYLIEANQIEVKPWFPGPTQFASIRSAVYQYLSAERQYSKEVVEQHFRAFGYLERFLVSRGVQEISDINQELLVDYQQTNNHCRSYKKYLRNILVFLYRDGFVDHDFSYIILVPKQKHNEVRRFLPPEQVDRILNSLPRTSKRDKRNYAIFVCMARMGFRIKETLALKLADIDWVNSSIKITGKKEKVSTLPMGEEVANAILDYLRNSNRGTDPELFVSMTRPFKKLQCFRHFTDILRLAYEVADVKCPTDDIRLNVFRHSFGTENLRDGVPMMVVRDLMRHENIATTMIYAKYDFESLRSLVSDWPGVSNV